MLRVEFTDTITPALQNAPALVEQAVQEVVRETGERIFNQIKLSTPRDSGKAAGGWDLSYQQAQGGAAATAVIENDVPYINVLEHGGYPVIPLSRQPRLPGVRRGRAQLDGAYPPGPRTQRAPGGQPTMLTNVSRQAPQGMVRVAFARAQDRFVFDLEEAIDRALAGGQA